MSSSTLFSSISGDSTSLFSDKWTLTILTASFLLVLLVIKETGIKFLQKSKLPFPPGPPKKLILGHLRVMPSENQADVFHEWAKVYGDVIGLQFLGRNVVVVDSFHSARELLDNRGLYYSCRPRFVVYEELMGISPALTFLQYGTKEFSKHRKIFQSFLGKHESAEYIPTQAEHAKILVRNLVKDPQQYVWYLEKYTTSIIIHITSGYQVIEDDDMYIKIAQDYSKKLNDAGSPGNTPIDYFPWLRYFPSWFPGTFYAFHARSAYKTMRRAFDFPVEYVRRQMTNGTAQPSFVHYLLEDLNASLEGIEDSPKKQILYQEELLQIAGAAGTLYTAGGETSYASLQTFILAMTLYPEVQRSAQDEIDRVLGVHDKRVSRLPEIEDRENLLFVECVLQELFRWHPVVPLGVPHRSTADDVYNGMSIPKGSIIFSNIRGMSLDERIYSDPDSFKPMRFMPKEKGGKEEPYFVAQWGFGRRICPGRYLADTQLWLAIVTILATLNIRKAKDENGKEIEPEVKFTDGLVSQPHSFQCDIKPRSENAARLVSPV
ncbi:cytochrome P450 [Dendrothele bispora CBS 962.96]|uniref:Cytochrome P450 n=1 Tax=Dendrothele bispora (strain CBS 962.96) TaxID=1314807 RepID=A0A4S8KVA3_DENBC|nr:cytochrome P450 [Dendrothele bispora CBS 962.96]